MNTVVVLDCVVVSMLDYHSRSPGFKSPGAEIWFEINALHAFSSKFSYNEYTVWKDETDGEGENLPPTLVCQG